MDSVPPGADESLPPLTRGDLLELDLDVRLRDVFLWALEDGLDDEATVGSFLRLAYAAGYNDALSEPVRGKLLRDHGYTVPPRQRPRGPRQ